MVNDSDNTISVCMYKNTMKHGPWWSQKSLGRIPYPLKGKTSTPVFSLWESRSGSKLHTLFDLLSATYKKFLKRCYYLIGFKSKNSHLQLRLQNHTLALLSSGAFSINVWLSLIERRKYLRVTSHVRPNLILILQVLKLTSSWQDLKVRGPKDDCVPLSVWVILAYNPFG